MAFPVSCSNPRVCKRNQGRSSGGQQRLTDVVQQSSQFHDEEAVGGGEALLGGEGEREVADAERVGGVVGGVAPAHLPLHQLLRAPHRRRRHLFSLVRAVCRSRRRPSVLKLDRMVESRQRFRSTRSGASSDSKKTILDLPT